MGASEGPENMESSRLLKAANLKGGGLSSPKLLWRDSENRTEMMTEKQSQRSRNKENSGHSEWL